MSNARAAVLLLFMLAGISARIVLEFAPSLAADCTPCPNSLGWDLVNVGNVCMFRSQARCHDAPVYPSHLWHGAA